jgi:hypothetical protein
MTNNETIILSRLRKYHRGKECAITFKRLSYLTGINQREVRMCVAELVTYHEQPIAGTSDAGYYVISSKEEYDHASNELMSRIRKLSKRHKGLRHGYMKSKQYEKPKQLVML